ncbi:MAG: LPS assembly lipoprotein LptE [Rhodospirillales bacterium]
MTRRGLALIGVVAAALSLGGCGFRPLYGERAAAPEIGEKLADVGVDIIPDRSGQILRNELLDRMTPRGAPGAPAYHLGVALTESRQEFAIRQDETATRSNVIFSARFALRRASDNQVIHGGIAVVRNSYDLLQNKFATLSAEEDARTRALRQLAEEIRTRLAIYFERSSGA